MRKLAFHVAIAAGIMAPAALTADEKQPNAAARPAPAKSADEDAIRATAAAFVKAFEAGDAQALADLWTSNGDYISETGQTCQGREAIKKRYESLFRDYPGTKIKIEIASIRLLGPHEAIEDGMSSLQSADGRRISSSRYTAVHVKESGKWLLSAVRDMPIEAASQDAMQALEPLVGDWISRRDEATVQTHCEWIADRRFLQRTYTVEKKGAVALSGMQIVGWDPAAKRIRSWTFDSTGGHGEGEWAPLESGWMIESAGVLADGELTASTEILHMVNENVIGWRSINRVAGGSPLADTEEVVLERIPSRAK